MTAAIHKAPRRRAILLGIAAAMLLATACGGGTNITSDIQARYAGLKEFTATVDIAADYGDRVSHYTVVYEQTSPGEASISIERPSEIAGMTAHIKGGGSELHYDGLILETGPLAGTALTPIDAVPAMLAAWAVSRASDFSSTQYNGVKCWQLTFLSSAGENTIEQTAWFSADTLKPIRAETSADGRLVIACDFTSAEW